LKVRVTSALAGERADRIISLLTGVSRSAAAAAVTEGRVFLGEQRLFSGSRRLREGEEITIPTFETEVSSGLEPEADISFQVLYEDQHVIIVEKPAGLIVHPGSGHETGTLSNGLLASYPELSEIGEPRRPGIVHRLDRGTSGLLMVARSVVAYRELVKQLAAREIDRRYLCLVYGRVEAEEGIVEAPIGRSHSDRTRMAVAVDGREARTRYRVDRRCSDPAVTLLRCQLETGRTHQIRVHMGAIGHPVVGDRVYGRSGDHMGLDRLFLHADYLGFIHPVCGEPMYFESTLPGELDALLMDLLFV